MTKVISEKPPIVEVLWDGTPDIQGSEDPSTSDQKLLPTKFNKDKEGAWRMDMDIELEDDSDDDDEEGSNNEEEDVESECEEEIDWDSEVSV